MQHNLGRALPSDLVKGGLRQPLDLYAEQGSWGDRQPASILEVGRLASDGSVGTRDLYGVSFTVDAAKAADKLPIQLGAADKYSAARVCQHLILYEDNDDFRRWIYGEGQTAQSPGWVEAAE